MSDTGGSRRWTRIFRQDPRAEIEEELSFHLEQRVRDNIARGMDAEAARAAAESRLGDVRRVRAECTELLASEHRSADRRVRLNVSLLDFRLGIRMLFRYPALTLLGTFAMAFAIWVGAGAFELITRTLYPRLPLEDGDRIVGVRLWDAAGNQPESRALYEFVTWRDEVRTLDGLGAFRSRQLTLIPPGGGPEPVSVSEVTSSAFGIARVQPVLGRVLQPSDEAPDAPHVVVLGHSIWWQRFAGAADVLGSEIRLGGVPTTVVGVMPEKYGFPRSEGVWIPLRIDAAHVVPRGGSGIRMFARLSAGVTMAQAQAELTALGQRAAADNPDTHRHIRPEVMPYARSILTIRPLESALLMSSNLFVVMLMVLVCGNVALLMFARAATRESELVVRSALGASRARIVMQLFIEALVLGALALGIGLSAAGYGLRWAYSIITSAAGPMPFWMDDGLSPATVVYAILLTLLGAAIAGVLPGLRITRGLQAQLRHAGSSGISFGGVWTVIIAAQIAVTMTFPVTTFFLKRDVAQIHALDADHRYNEYLGARIALDNQHTTPLDSAAFSARFLIVYDELHRRLEQEPGITAVTFADRLPRMYHPHRLIELDAGGAAPVERDFPGYRVSAAAVDPQFFATFELPLIAGRSFHTADIGSDHRVAIVNETFVERVLGGRHPVGRHFRFTHFEERSPENLPEQPWVEIVGVVPSQGVDPDSFDPKSARIYTPASPIDAYPLAIALHSPGAAETLGPRLREIAAAVDPALRVQDPMPLDRMSQGDLDFLALWFRLTLIVSGLALMLSLAAIYSVMSFAVSRRTREIGIRAALGAPRRRILAATFSRPFNQVAIGIAAGAVPVTLFMFMITGGVPSLSQVLAIGAYAILTLAVCMLACVVPTRRALRVAPAEAMRVDG